MKKKLGYLFIVVLLAALSVLPASAAQTSGEQEALQISALINEYRQQSGLYQYIYNPTLAATAQAHSEYQASIEESTHYGEGDSRSRDRAEAMGYGNGTYIFVSEMIYAGEYATPQAALTWWKNSPIHNGIMLSTEYHEFGVGVARSETHIYYTVNVGAVRGVTAPTVGSTSEINPAASSESVVTSEPDDLGGIYHIVGDGQTLTRIAEAYDVDEGTLRLLNGLIEDSALNVGQLLLIQQPQASDEEVIVEEDQAEAEPTSTVEQPTPTEEETEEPPTEEPAPTNTEAPATAVPTEAVTGQEDSGGMNWLIFVFAGIAVLAASAFAYFAFLQKQESDEEREEEEEAEEDEHAGHDTSDFDHQTRQRQFDLLKEVAEVALDAYPLDVVKIEPLRYVLNAEFLVDARPEGSSEIEQYVVRVNAPGFHTRVEIASELEWLHTLNNDTDLNVPNPLRKRDGEWVATVEQPFLNQPRHCVVFHYIPGSTIEMEARPEHLELAGVIIAMLHNHGAQFTPPPGFVRKHWDMEGLTGGMLDVPAKQAYAALSDHEREIVDKAEKLVAGAMEKIGRTDRTYGLIHGDLHLKSFLFHEGKPLILDFDTCGYGYYAYDLAVPIWNLFQRDDFALLRAALLKGYRHIRPLSDEEESLLIYFVAGRLMTQILAWAGRREHSNLSEVADEAIKRQVKQLEALIRLLVG